MTSDDPTPAEAAPPPGRGLGAWCVLFAITATVFFFMWSHERERRVWLERGDPLKTVEVEHLSPGARIVYRWKDDGAIATTMTDRDDDSIGELVVDHDKQGRFLTTSTDANENGLYELVEIRDRDGRRVSTWFDEDDDGLLDFGEIHYPSGWRVVWRDLDGDQIFERRESYDPSGELMSVYDDLGGASLVEVK